MLESHISGDIVILNREQVGNPQSCHEDCQVEIANLVGIIEHYIESFFYRTRVRSMATLVTNSLPFSTLD